MVREIFGTSSFLDRSSRAIIGRTRLCLRYSLVVELHYRITGDVSHIDEATFLDAFRMLSQHQPADVRIEESTV